MRLIGGKAEDIKIAGSRLQDPGNGCFPKDPDRSLCVPELNYSMVIRFHRPVASILFIPFLVFPFHL